MRLDPRRTDLPTNKCVVAVSNVDIDLTKKQYVHHAPFLILLHFMQTCHLGGICSHASHSLSLFTRTPLCSLPIFLHCLSISLCPLTSALTHPHRYELLLRIMNENLGSEPWMKFEMHEDRLSRGSQSPSRRHPADLDTSAHGGNLERALYTQVTERGGSLGLGGLSVGAGSDTAGDNSSTSARRTSTAAPHADADGKARVLPEFYGSITFTNVRMEIFLDEVDGGAPEPLARLDLIDTTISYASSSDGTDEGFSSQVRDRRSPRASDPPACTSSHTQCVCSLSSLTIQASSYRAHCCLA
jgi:hypothetical protein